LAKSTTQSRHLSLLVTSMCPMLIFTLILSRSRSIRGLVLLGNLPAS
jgi:hypothetical protein